MVKTVVQFDKAAAMCRDIFVKKMDDYGISWRILRPSSLTDQIYIKANRIRSIEEKGERKVEEGYTPEYIGIANYSVMALIQLKLGPGENEDLERKEVIRLYDNFMDDAKNLMLNKNHDYGEAWRYMRGSSYTDIILMKLMRVKEIENHQGKTKISEGLDANYLDIINYAVFALIKLDEEGEN